MSLNKCTQLDMQLQQRCLPKWSLCPIGHTRCPSQILVTPFRPTCHAGHCIATVLNTACRSIQAFHAAEHLRCLRAVLTALVGSPLMPSIQSTLAMLGAAGVLLAGASHRREGNGGAGSYPAACSLKTQLSWPSAFLKGVTAIRLLLDVSREYQLL